MTMLISETVKGNHVLIDRGAHLRRWINAEGPDVVKYINDFTGGSHNPTGAEMDMDVTVTRVEAGQGESTISLITGSGGIIRISADGNDADGINAQWLPAGAFKFKSTNYLYFGAFGVTLSEATQSAFFLGLAVTDTTLIGGVSEDVSFRKADASTAMSFVVEEANAETTASGVLTVVGATAYDLEFFWDGPNNKLEAFINGVSVAVPAVTNIPDAVDVRPSWQFLAGQAQSPNYQTCDIDKLVVIQIGR